MQRERSVARITAAARVRLGAVAGGGRGGQTSNRSPPTDDDWPFSNPFSPGRPLRERTRAGYRPTKRGPDTGSPAGGRRRRKTNTTPEADSVSL